MPATLRTIDMTSVYDGLQKELEMVMKVAKPVLLAMLAVGVSANGAKAQNQPQTSPPTTDGSMKPMDKMAGMRPTAVPSGPLKVSFGDKSAEWTPAALAALPHKTLTVYNEHVKASQTFTGVPLIDLLLPLGVPAKQHGKDLRLYLVAEGADGYEAVYSVAEINPDVHNATVMVADTLDGKSLADSGPLQLVATGEKRPARWVRNLVAVRVLTAQ
jgi:hypothetical protein